MKNSNLLRRIGHLFLLVVVTCSFSCRKEKGIACHTGFNWYAEVLEEATELGNALLAYSNDPSDQNCDRYIDAANLYLDALAEYEDCAVQLGEKADYEKLIADARKDLQENGCE